jgi:hypothetical protein
VQQKWCADLPEFRDWMRTQRRRLCNEAYWHAGQALEEGDEQGLATCLAFAGEYDQTKWRSTAWWKFRAKALVGRSAWKRFGPWIQSARGRAPTHPVKKIVGWWPEQVVAEARA